MSAPSRVPAGTGVRGGQFAPGQHAESAVSVSVSVSVGAAAPLSVDEQRIAEQANDVIAQQDRINELYGEIFVAREKLAEDSVRLMSAQVRLRHPDANTIDFTYDDEDSTIGFEAVHEHLAVVVVDRYDDQVGALIPGASRHLDLEELGRNVQPVPSGDGAYGAYEDFSITIDDTLGPPTSRVIVDGGSVCA